MCQKKLLLFLPLLTFLFISAASPQDILKESKSQTQGQQNYVNSSQNNAQTLKKNSIVESKSVQNSNNQLTKQELESMSAWTLLDNLDLTIEKLEQRVATQDLLLANSETELLNTKIELQNSKQLVKTLKEALISNKDDTSTIIQVAGELQSEIDALTQRLSLTELRLKHSHIYTNVSGPVLFGTGIVEGVGTYMLIKGIKEDDSNLIRTGSAMMIVGGVSLAVFEITFNGGTKLKLW